MKTIFLILLISYFIQNSFALPEKTITILSPGIFENETTCANEATENNPYFVFYLITKTKGFTVEEEFKIKLESPTYAYALCSVYPSSEDDGPDYLPCTVNILIYPLNSLTLPKKYTPYEDGIDEFTFNNWDIIAGKKLLDDNADCYPFSLFKFTPNDLFEVKCDSSYNSLTIYGNFDYNSSITLNENIDFEPYVIVDGKLSKGRCIIPIEKTNSGENKMVCNVIGRSTAQFFPTSGQDRVTQFNILIGGPSKSINLSQCASSFIKSTSIFLILLFLLIK